MGGLKVSLGDVIVPDRQIDLYHDQIAFLINIFDSEFEAGF